MRQMLLLGIPVLLAACADATPTQPASQPGQPSLAVASVLSTRIGAASAIYYFYDCVGPSGTPTSFSAEKTALPSAAGQPVSAAGAFRLTDGSAVFVVLSFGEGNFSPPGISVSGNATTTCLVSTSNGILAFSGFLAPSA